MIYYDDCPEPDEPSPDAIALAEAREEIEACYQLLDEIRRFEHWLPARLLRKIEARLLPAAKGSTLAR